MNINLNNDGNVISFSKFTSDTTLSKEFRLNDAGNIQKHSSAQMYSGTVEIVTTTIEKFADHLETAGSNTAFSYGLLPVNNARIVTNGKENPTNNTYARTKEYFSYKPVPGILMLDHDPSPYGPKVSPEEMINILEVIHPEIAKAYIVVRGSLSSGVRRLNDEPPDTPASYHLYLFVKDASDIPRYSEILYKKLWIEGYGFIALSARGDLLERSIIDKSVFSPERLDFVGKPVIKDQRLKYTDPGFITAKGDLLDTKTLLNLELGA